jgi:hypothetical protein
MHPEKKQELPERSPYGRAAAIFTGFPVNELQGFAGYQIIRNKTGIIVFSLKR